MMTIQWPEALGHPGIDALRDIETAAHHCVSLEDAQRVIIEGVRYAQKIGKLQTLSNEVIGLAGDILVHDTGVHLYTQVHSEVIGNVCRVRTVESAPDKPRIVCEMSEDSVCIAALASEPISESSKTRYLVLVLAISMLM